MNVERMTQRVQEALDNGYQRALREHHTQTTVEHILAALLEQEDGIVPGILQAAGVDPREIARRVNEELARQPRLSGANADQAHVTASPQLSRLLAKADERSEGAQRRLRFGRAPVARDAR